MKEQYYDVEVYELHKSTYRVKAASLTEAINQWPDGSPDADDPEYIETADLYSRTLEDLCQDQDFTDEEKAELAKLLEAGEMSAIRSICVSDDQSEDL